MRTRHFGAAILSAILLSACGGGGEPADERAQSADSADSAPRETVFDPLVGTLDRARGVQQTVDEHAAELRRRIEEDEQ